MVKTRWSYVVDGERIEHPWTLPQRMNDALDHIQSLLRAMQDSQWEDSFKIEVEAL